MEDSTIDSRQRTSKACELCRHRKARCNGLNPCAVCVRRRGTCTYRTINRIRQPPPFGDRGRGSSRIDQHRKSPRPTQYRSDRNQCSTDEQVHKPDGHHLANDLEDVEIYQSISATEPASPHWTSSSMDPPQTSPFTNKLTEL